MKWFLLLIILLIVSCATISDDPNALPEKASNINDIGNGWVTFKLDGKKFMFKQRKEGYSEFAVITQILDCEE